MEALLAPADTLAELGPVLDELGHALAEGLAHGEVAVRLVKLLQTLAGIAAKLPAPVGPRAQELAAIANAGAHALARGGKDIKRLRRSRRDRDRDEEDEARR
jgi:hypothetical protein